MHLDHSIFTHTSYNTDESKEERNKVSTIHTVAEMMTHDAMLSDLRPVDPQEMETLRLELEKQLGLLNQMHGTPEEV